MFSGDARAFRWACVFGIIVHAVALAGLIAMSSGDREKVWVPLAVLDMSPFDPSGGLGGAGDTLLAEETAPEPELPLPEEPMPEPELEPEELHVLESVSERAESLPPPPPHPTGPPRERPGHVPVLKPGREAAPPGPSVSALAAAPGTGGSGPGGPPGGVGSGNPNELEAYKAAVRRRLERRKKYPPAARARRLAGVVRVSFTIARDGSISSPVLVESSGHGILDDEAMALLARASPLPPIPNGAGLSALNISVPLRFSLN
ncbi:MAG: energy transducer TonB [Deltaproteobacteria bacterium]|jgi:protein TonB|nr:energy transducer TonB [Deltaproteobacteria bacterium]